LEEDFQTASDVVMAKGKIDPNKSKRSIISTRHYLSDADFLVGLEGEIKTLTTISEALRSPVWPLFLGRKGYVPLVPIWIPDGLKEGVGLRDSLVSYPWPRLLTEEPRRIPESLKLVIESGGGLVREDVPLSFNTRRFTTRRVTVEYVDLEKIPRWS
jgi:CRISPR system Cascade subunit CasD